jgi:diacylglycerol kinase (ATP)
MKEAQNRAIIKLPIAVVYNPAAGGGKSGRRRWFIESALKANGIPYDLFMTDNESHMIKTAESVVQRYKVIVAAGGDTTVNLIATQVLNHGTKNTLGVFATGSVNDLARELGLLRLKDSLAALKNGATCDMDVGILKSGLRSEPYFFLVSASLGLGVAITRYVDEWMRKHRLLANLRSSTGIPAGMSAIRQAFKNKEVPLRITLETGGEVQEIQSALMAFSNIASLAGLFRPSPMASPVSGFLDCCIFDITSLSSAVQVALDIKRKTHLSKKEVTIIRDRSFRISSENPLYFQMDGSIIGTGRVAEISLLPRALRMYTGKSCFQSRL